MSEIIEVASLAENESNSNQQENSDFVYWINSFNLRENSNLNYPFDRWQTICSLFWILIFIISAIVLILISRK